jgi:transcriptional regulator with XRE-family HTH domain
VKSATTVLKAFRDLKGLTLAQLADAVGSSAPTLCKIERGDCIPSAQLRQDLAAFFGIDPNRLLSEVEVEHVSLR